MVRDEETQKMVEKCKEMGNKPEVVTTCKIVLETMEKRNQNFLKRLMPIKVTWKWPRTSNQRTFPRFLKWP